MAKVNGEEHPEADGGTLAAWLAAAGFDERRVACELDGEIVPREEYGARTLGPHDAVEVVRFVGGG
ncbi:sulfur carrier protein ThiS [Arabiibacter massiliensis]|uniref:sulfur carrier protein ThiS n=1 Tax=Arabiibacter massiliensis TaxID=1870985 RepID=UPI0009B936E3|nr:sulfur carrier protein ThiS [Arabiibacter massiliensis]